MIQLENYKIQILLSVTEVAKILNISRAFAYNLIKTGEIRSVHIHTSRRVRHNDLEKYIENNLRPIERN